MSQYVSILTTEDPALSLPLSLSLSLPLSLPLSIYVSLWLQDTCHMMPFTKQHSAYAWVVTCILFLINLTFHNLPLHSSYKIHQPFTDYFLRLPYSELLEKRLFRSRANRRLVNSVNLLIPVSGPSLRATSAIRPYLRKKQKAGSQKDTCCRRLRWVVRHGCGLAS